MRKLYQKPHLELLSDFLVMNEVSLSTGLDIEIDAGDGPLADGE